MAMNAIWITWEDQIRNRSMAAALGAKLITLICRGSRLKRYSICLLRTLFIVFRERPEIIFAQNPSIFLNYVLICARYFFKFKLVSDAHFAGVIAFSGNTIIQKALDYCNKFVDLVIVTNDEHYKHITDIGGRALICEDPLPDIIKYRADEINEVKEVFFICSYDVDEPYYLAFKASELLLKDNYRFFVTGNYRKAGINPEDYPSVNFLGYLPEKDYYIRLFQSSVVLDLTESENCLVCGAYEAMAAERPLVTSETVCLRNYFNKGTVFSKHDVTSITDAIKEAYQNRERLKEEIRIWKNEIVDLQKTRIESIKKTLGIIESE